MLEQVVAEHDVERSKIQVGGRSNPERYVVEALAFSPLPCSVHVWCVSVYPEDRTNDLGRGDCVGPETGTKVEKTTLSQRLFQLGIEQAEHVLDVLRAGNAAALDPFRSPMMC